MGSFAQQWFGFGLSIAAACAIAPANAADIPYKAPPSQWAVSAPAVDGLNGKADLFGGSLGGHGLAGGSGSFSVPIGHQFGFQGDGLVGAHRGDFLGGVGAHMFWRDPAKGLIGVYGDYVWSEHLGSRVGHFGVEGALYHGRFSLDAVGGVEAGNSRFALVNGFFESVNFKTRPFDKIDLSYYFLDDLKASIGHRYYGGKHAFALGTEWAFAHFNTATSSLFVEARLGNESSVWGGLRVYVGQKAKKLIRRHREDDPPGNLTDSSGAFGGAGSTVPGVICTPPCGQQY